MQFSLEFVCLSFHYVKSKIERHPSPKGCSPRPLQTVQTCKFRNLNREKVSQPLRAYMLSTTSTSSSYSSLWRRIKKKIKISTSFQVSYIFSLGWHTTLDGRIFQQYLHLEHKFYLSINLAGGRYGVRSFWFCGREILHAFYFWNISISWIPDYLLICIAMGTFGHLWPIYRS